MDPLRTIVQALKLVISLITDFLLAIIIVGFMIFILLFVVVSRPSQGYELVFQRGVPPFVAPINWGL
ncbi:TPA_asm: hypothetical protein [ssRNA phage SRR6960803_7]|uniref:Uncharacterized protein n=1 Tax=ssRNA phage SRR6960803_7 TaxID=2786623 RepID=A0A8S5L0V1_9VIRU|nr:hypothetical protein QIL70_gp1 [ssRNA phage SRR6960803_7]DAD50738.1 TPA_asm: hypothetical protein [ssRNA phage SRR6960803_7]